MTAIGEQLLAALLSYGLPILAVVMFVGCLGLPLPNALLLIASGSFSAAGGMNLWTVLTVASVSAIAGDLSGYAIGRWAGAALFRRLGRKLRNRLNKAEQSMREWGGWGVFLTRWLITPLGPFVNLVAGATHYPWPRFVLWDILGEILWVVLYVELGRLIAGEVQAVSALAGDISWITLAVAVTSILLWTILKSRRNKRPSAAALR